MVTFNAGESRQTDAIASDVITLGAVGTQAFIGAVQAEISTLTRFIAVSAIIPGRTKALTRSWLTFGAIFTFALVNAVSAVSTLRAFLHTIRPKPAPMTGAIAGHGITLAVFAGAFCQTTGSVISHVTGLIAKLSLLTGLTETNAGDGIAASHLALASLQAIRSEFAFGTRIFAFGSHETRFAFLQTLARHVIARRRRRTLAFLLAARSVRPRRTLFQTLSPGESVLTLTFARLRIATSRIFFIAITTFHAIRPESERRTPLIAHFAVISGGTFAVAKQPIASPTRAFHGAFPVAIVAEVPGGTPVFAVDASDARRTLASARFRVAFALVLTGAVAGAIEAVGAVGTGLVTKYATPAGRADALIAARTAFSPVRAGSAGVFAIGAEGAVDAGLDDDALVDLLLGWRWLGSGDDSRRLRLQHWRRDDDDVRLNLVVQFVPVAETAVVVVVVVVV